MYDTILPMFETKNYELVDFRDGRKLERFGSVLVERPCPTASRPFDDELFDDPAEVAWDPQLRFVGKTGYGKWNEVDSQPNDWHAQYDLDFFEKPLTFELSASESGQVGLFPEQATNWEWIAKKCSARSEKDLPPPKILNLFAYTGGSTLAAAMSGAEVTHVDAAKSVVAWARRNAAHSGLSDAPIRWIVEDAPKFVRREVKRGNKYDGIILDPPSYGHGPKREEWKISRDLIELLGDCKKLLADLPTLFLLSCHTPGFGEPELSAALSTCLFGSCGAGVKTRPLELRTPDGRRLPSGHAAYWP